MIFDHRTYTCRPGTIKKQLALYGEHGFPAQCRHLGHPWLYAATEVGDVNSYVHIEWHDTEIMTVCMVANRPSG